MKKFIVLFCLIFCFTNNASGKVIYPSIPLIPEPTKNVCYDKSNNDYNMCMWGCISNQSPREIIELCSHKCFKITNNKFFNCLLNMEKVK